jgi:hypothetical protein
LLKELKMHHSKTYILDVKKPGNAEEILAERRDEALSALKEEGYELKDIVIGFFDESSTQLSPNTVRLWSFKKLKIRRITTRQKKRANTLVLTISLAIRLMMCGKKQKSLKRLISEVFIESVESSKGFVKDKASELFKKMRRKRKGRQSLLT